MNYAELIRNEYGVPIPKEKTAVRVTDSVESGRVIEYARSGAKAYTVANFPRCINLLDGCHAPEGFYAERAFKIISFQEFLDLKTKIEVVKEEAKKDLELKQIQDKVLAHIKSYLPDFTWGCELEIVNLDHWGDKTSIGKKFKAVSPETWRTDANASQSILTMSNVYATCGIDPLNTYGINYYFKSLKVASPVKEEKTTKMDKSEAKKKADALMGCLPEYQTPSAKKPVKESAPMESACPESLRKFSVGDSVLYMDEVTVIAAKRYNKNDYIVEYRRGWDGSPTESTSEGKLVEGKKYHYASEERLKSISPVSKSDPTPSSTLYTPPPTSTSDFKVGDWVVITESRENWNDDMATRVGKCVQITRTKSTLASGPAIEFKNDGGWYWCYSKGHFRKATSQEIAHELSKLSPGINSTTIQLDGFRVGDKVKVISGGSGIAATDKGKYVTITELGVGKYSGQNAARIAESIGNQVDGAYDRWISLRSFEVPRVGDIDPHKDHDVIYNQSPPRDSWKEPKYSDIIALKEEPHTITTSLAEPLVLQIKKKSIKVVTV